MRLANSAVARLQRRLDELELAILQRDLQAAQRAPGRDIPAHDPGADHVHTLERGGRLAAQPLEAILQQEHRAPGSGRPRW